MNGAETLHVCSILTITGTSSVGAAGHWQLYGDHSVVIEDSLQVFGELTVGHSPQRVRRRSPCPLGGRRHGRGPAPTGNVTDHLRSSCQGQARCDYRIDHSIIGDPAFGCAKDYVAEWQCGPSGPVRSTRAEAEAGFGSTIELRCP